MIVRVLRTVLAWTISLAVLSLIVQAGLFEPVIPPPSRGVAYNGSLLLWNLSVSDSITLGGVSITNWTSLNVTFAVSTNFSNYSGISELSMSSNFSNYSLSSETAMISNYSNVSNSSNYWDNLNSPSQIKGSDIINDEGWISSFTEVDPVSIHNNTDAVLGRLTLNNLTLNCSEDLAACLRMYNNGYLFLRVLASPPYESSAGTFELFNMNFYVRDYYGSPVLAVDASSEEAGLFFYYPINLYSDLFLVGAHKVLLGDTQKYFYSDVPGDTGNLHLGFADNGALFIASVEEQFGTEVRNVTEFRNNSVTFNTPLCNSTGSCFTLSELNMSSGGGSFSADQSVNTTSNVTFANLWVTGKGETISSPTSATYEIVEGYGYDWWNGGDCIYDHNQSIRVFAYKDVNGTRIYSTGSANVSYYFYCDVYSDFTINWSWSAVAGADGYRLLLNHREDCYGDCGGCTEPYCFNYYVDTENTFFEDSGWNLWSAGNSTIPTTAYSNQIKLNGFITNLQGPITIDGKMTFNSDVDVLGEIQMNGKTTFVSQDSAGNWFTGPNACKSAVGQGITCIGDDAGGNASNIGKSTLVGSNAGRYANGVCDAFGYNALSSVTSGYYNSAFGSEALSSVLDGTNNVAIGTQAAYLAKSPDRSVYIGASSGYRDVSGQDNTLIGYNTAFSDFASFKGCIVIGSYAYCNKNNTMTVGSYQVPVTMVYLGAGHRDLSDILSANTDRQVTIKVSDAYPGKGKAGYNLTLETGTGDGSSPHGSLNVRINNKNVLTANDTTFSVLGNTSLNGHLSVTGNITGNAIYGEMWMHNDTGVAFPFSASGVYYNASGFNCSVLNGFTCNGGTTSDGGWLNATVDGLYDVRYHASGAGVNNHVYHAGISKNGVVQYNTETHFKLSGTGDTVTLSGGGFIRLAAGDKLRLVFEDSTGTGAGTVYSMSVRAVRIGT